MLAHLEALKTEVAALGYTTYIGYADPDHPSQYVVLEGKGWEHPDELPICSTSDSLDTEVRFKAVTGTTTGVFKMLAKIRDHFSPNRGFTPIAVAGRSAAVRFERSEFVGVDRDETITATSRHPAFGVDSYRLVSQPA